MFYCFDQNNTGGIFTINDQFAEDVFIEATSEDDANDRAEAYGLYFDGCQDGYDCDCCGDRWYRAWKESGKDQPIVSVGTFMGAGEYREVALEDLTAADLFGPGDGGRRHPGPWTPDDKPFAIVVFMNGEVKRYRRNDYLDQPLAITTVDVKAIGGLKLKVKLSDAMIRALQFAATPVADRPRRGVSISSSTWEALVRRGLVLRPGVKSGVRVWTITPEGTEALTSLKK